MNLLPKISEKLSIIKFPRCWKWRCSCWRSWQSAARVTSAGSRIRAAMAVSTMSSWRSSASRFRYGSSFVAISTKPFFHIGSAKGLPWPEADGRVLAVRRHPSTRSAWGPSQHRLLASRRQGESEKIRDWLTSIEENSLSIMIRTSRPVRTPFFIILILPQCRAILRFTYNKILTRLISMLKSTNARTFIPQFAARQLHHRQSRTERAAQSVYPRFWNGQKVH